ncbi:putative methyltransferase-domain-containing protein [Pyrenochaeta sp. MPI-SDFR-AT-0127]|nr:putative methyltransferase-domain-containing protein [Pyrenochaeta sp. MPI-SDFR-AT-0127]
MRLPSLISLRRPASAPLEPEDIFGSSLGSIFTDDLQNQHGDDPETVILYRSAKYGELEFRTADVNCEEQRRKFAHYLWNAGVLMGELVSGREEKRWRVQGETVLELGAGVGLGGIVSALAGAKEVAITDYPAPPIVNTIKTNVAENIPASLQPNVTVQGHMWGAADSPFEAASANHYTRILAADCLWMPWEHQNLAKSMLHFLADSPDARILCIAGFHTGRAKVAPFFEEVVPQQGLEIEDIYEMDADGQRRPWAKERDGGTENIGERKKWLVLAQIRRAVR